MMRIPTAPIFVDKLPSLVSGVDFLGLGAVNERLIADFLPGINNVTRYMRVYSVMCWMAWRFDEHFRGEKEKLPVREINKRFSLFREKVELLFTWGNQGRGIGLVGARRSFAGKGTQKLVFSALGASVASWLDAAQYGPSLKIDNGLGFLETAAGSTLRPTRAGVDLALALDAVLRRSPYYDRLCDLSDNAATPAMAKDLGDRWSICSSSEDEQRIFRNAFAPIRTDPDSTMASTLTRCGVVRLIWSALKSCGGKAAVREIREVLARGIDASGHSLADPNNRHLLRLWTALQIRQLQRLCHEALLRWVELSLLNPMPEQNGRSTASLARYCAVLASRHLEVSPQSTVAELKSAIKSKLGRHATPLLAGRTVGAVDPFEHMQVLKSLGSSPAEVARLPALAAYGLAIVAVQAEALEGDDLYARLFTLGSRDRISVSTLVELLHMHSAQPLSSFVAMLIESCTTSQHFATAAARLEPGKNKYRFLPSEDGLKPMISPSQVLVLGSTADRLEVAMHLMADCGLLRRTSSSEFRLPSRSRL